MTKSEHTIQKQIQLALSKHHCTVFRANVAKVHLADGRWLSTGLPDGFFDLFGFNWRNNKIFFIEVKNAKGKPREDQIRFHCFLQKHFVCHGIARSAEEAVSIVKKDMIGYGFDE